MKLNAIKRNYVYPLNNNEFVCDINSNNKISYKSIRKNNRMELFYFKGMRNANNAI